MASVFEKVGKKVKDALSSSGKQTKQSVASSNKALTGTRNDKATTTSTNKVTTKNVNTGANLVNQSSGPDISQAINKVASEVAKPIATGTVQPIRRVDPVKVAPIGGQDKPVISTPRVGSIDISKLQGNKALDSTAMQSIMANNSEKRNEHQRPIPEIGTHDGSRPIPSIGGRNTDGLDIGAEQAMRDNAIRDAQLPKEPKETGRSAFDLGKTSMSPAETEANRKKNVLGNINAREGYDPTAHTGNNRIDKALNTALSMEGEKQGRLLKANADGSAPKGVQKGDVIVSNGWTRTVKDVDKNGNAVFEKGYATGSDAIDARMLSQDDKYMVDKYQREWSAYNDALKEATKYAKQARDAAALYEANGDAKSAADATQQAEALEKSIGEFQKGMDDAHKKAEDVRKRYGYSGGSAGAGYKSKDGKNHFDNPEEEQKTSSVSAMDRFKEFARLATNADIGEAKAKEDRQNDRDLVDQLEKKAMSQDYEGDTNVGLMTQEGRDAERSKVGSNTKTETRTWNLPGQDPITVETQIANGNAGGGSLTRNGKLWDFGGKDVIDDTAIELMTGKEKRTYATIYKTEGADKAREYLDALSRVRLNERVQQKEAQDAAQFGADHQVIASVASPLLNATAGTVAGATNAVYSLGNTLYNMSGGKIPTYHAIDPNAAYNRYADLGSQTRQGVIESIDTGNKTVDAILGFLYEGGESMLDMAANTALFGGIGSKAVTTAMSSQSAQSAWNESLRNGATQEQAAANALVNGLLEFVSESPAVEGLFDIGGGKMLGKSAKDRFKILVGQGMTEGGGEAFANITQTYADHAIMGDKSNYSQVVNNYMAQGYDEKTANAMAFRDIYMLDTARAFGLGFFTGEGMGGVATGINMYNTAMERGNKLSTKDENGQPVYANSATVRDIADTGAKIAEDLGLEERFQKTIEKLKSQSEGGKITHTKDNRVGIIELADLKGAIQEKCREQAAKDINEFYNYVGLSASDVPHEMARHLGRFTGSDTTGFGNRKFSKAWEKKASEVGTDIDFLMFDPNQTGYSENYVKLMVDKANQYKDMTPEQLFEEQQRIEEEANQFYEMSTILNYAGVLNDEQQGLSNYVRSQVNKYLNGYEASAGGTSPVATDDDDIYDISQITELNPSEQGEVVTDTTTPTEATAQNVVDDTVNTEDDTQSDTTDTSSDTSEATTSDVVEQPSEPTASDTVENAPKDGRTRNKSTANNNERRGVHISEYLGNRLSDDADYAVEEAENNPDIDFGDYDIVRYDSDTDKLTLIDVDDFDGAYEPRVMKRTIIYSNGKVVTSDINGTEIIPDKSNYVSDDYRGFDIEAQREHERLWRKSGINYDSSRINDLDYFYQTFGNVFDVTPMEEVETTPNETVDEGEITPTQKDADAVRDIPDEDLIINNVENIIVDEDIEKLANEIFEATEDAETVEEVEEIAQDKVSEAVDEMVKDSNLDEEVVEVIKETITEEIVDNIIEEGEENAETEEPVAEEVSEDDTGSEGQSRPDTRTDESEQVTAEEEADTGNESETEGQTATETEPVSDVSEEAEENNEVEDASESTIPNSTKDSIDEILKGRKNAPVSKRAETVYKKLRTLCEETIRATEEVGFTMYIPVNPGTKISRKLLQDIAYLNRKERNSVESANAKLFDSDERNETLSDLFDVIDASIARAVQSLIDDEESAAKEEQELQEEIDRLNGEEQQTEEPVEKTPKQKAQDKAKEIADGRKNKPEEKTKPVEEPTTFEEPEIDEYGEYTFKTFSNGREVFSGVIDGKEVLDRLQSFMDFDEETGRYPSFTDGEYATVEEYNEDTEETDVTTEGEEDGLQEDDRDVHSGKSEGSKSGKSDGTGRKGGSSKSGGRTSGRGKRNGTQSESEDDRGTDGIQQDEADAGTEHSESIGNDRDDEAASTGNREGQSAAESEQPVYERYYTDRGVDLSKKKPIIRANSNIEALRLYKDILNDGRKATLEEKQVLAQYSGWGGIKDALVGDKPEFESIREELRSLLTDREYIMASQSSSTAFFTPYEMIDGIYSIVNQLGMGNGVRVLEPSCGSGNFLGCMPSTMRENSSITAVELDAISADIASIVYDDVDVRHQNFKNFDDEHGIGLVVGNVPFGETTMSQTGVVNGKQKIHDFFINKSLSMVEDGGIVAVLTTHGTLDKATEAARKEMAEKANLLAAVRFPSGTFGSTTVISDLLIFQKKGEFVDDSYAQDFVKTVKTNGTTVSSYFVNHPEMVLGRMVPATNQFGDATIDVKSDGRTLEDVMSYIPTSVVSEQALRKLNDARKKAQQAKAEHDALDDAPHNVAEGTLRKIDGKMYTCHKGKWKPYEYRTNNGTGTVNEKKTKLASEMYDLLQDLEELLEFERTTESDTLVDKKIKEFNKKYDDFIKRNGGKTYLTSDDCKNAYKIDPGNYAKLAILEKTHKEGRKTVFDKKGDILTRRVLHPTKDITSADNVNDALNICLDAVGSVDMNLIAELCGITKDEAVAGLRGRVYKDPFSEDGRFEVAEEILSGNVREKYRTLEAKKERTEEEDELLERLFNAIPVDTPHDDIKLQLGVPWLGQEHTQDFIQKICGKNTTVSYNEATGRWNIKYKSDPSVKNKYGIHGKTPLDLIKHIMEGKPLTVYDSPGEINTDKTNAVIARAEMVREEFNTWLWEDEDRKNDIVKRFNERFNSDVARSYDGSYLEFPGMNPNITMNPHQANAVARMLNNRNNLLVHPVGSGKTFTMIAGALEMKRLGIAKKPVMVVPTNKVTDFLEDTYKLYPNAKVFAAEGDMAKGSNLNKLIAQINSEDYDLVILKTTTFRDFPLSPEYVDEYIQKQIAPLEKYYLDNKGSMDKKESDALLKSIESMKESLEASKNKAMETSAEIDVFFDECGFDALFVDECQNYKNLNFMTSMSKVNGVPEFKKDGSGYENLHMHMVTDLLNKRGNRIVFASATPVTNNLTELYNMQRYLQPEVLERLGLEAFDAWANTFGEVSQSVELNSTGTKLVEKLRFSKFNNLPELIRMLSPNFDFVDKGDLNIKLPNATFVDDKSKIEAEPSFILKLFNQAVEERILYDAEDKAAALKAYQDARMAALDIRFVRKKMIDAGLIPADTTDADLDIPGSKVNLCVQNVIDIYNQHNDNKQTQVIFLDSGVPKSKNSKNNTYDFDLYNDIKSKLIAAGIPEKEIAFAQKATTDDAKRRLSENVRSGQVRVLIGSTATAGVGLNLQDRLIAAHHIDAPYRPSDYEQRNGRIIRQGNSNEEVFIYNYSTKNSYDAPMWGMLDRKSKGINAVMSGKPLDRTIEDAGDISDIFSGLSVAAANNPALFELEDAKGVVKKLKGQKAAFTEQKRVRDNIIKNHPKKISDKEKIIQQIEKLQQTVEEHKDDPIKVGDTVYKTQKEASIAVYNAFMKLSDGDRYKGKIMFKVYGHDVKLYTDYNLDGKKVFIVEVLGVPYGTTSYVAYKDSEKFAKKSMPNADIKKFENIYLLAKNSIDNSRSERFLGFRAEELDALNIEYNEALSHKNDVFTKDDELEAAIADVNRLSDQLKKADTGKGKIPYTTYSKDEFLNGPEGYVEEVDEVEEVEEPEEENKNYTAEEARKVAAIYREFLSGELVGDPSYVEKYSELYKEYRNNDIDGFNNFYEGVKEIEGINVKTKEDAAAFMVAYSNIRDLDTSLVEKMDTEEKNVFRFAGRPRVYKSQKKEIASNFRRLKKQNVPIEMKSIEDVENDVTSPDNKVNRPNTRTPSGFISSGKMTTQEQRSTFKLDEALEQITDKEREWVRHKREIGDSGIRAVVQEIIDTFGMNYTPNSLTRKSVRGWYNIKSNKMFTQTPVILGTALHETGHYLDRTDSFVEENYDAIVQMLQNAPGLYAELKARGYAEDVMPYEAVAELAWQWMANPDGAWTLGSYGVSEDHPQNLYESFEEFFSAETLEKMRHIRSILAVYYNASTDTTAPSEPVVTNLDKVVGTSRTRQEARKYKEKNGYVDRNFIQRKRDQILTRLVNSETRFRDFSKKVRDITGKELSRSERVDVALKLLGNYGTMSDALITKGFITPDGTVLEGIGSYASILQRLEKKVLDIKNPNIERRHKVNFAKYFDAYLKAQHALEWEADGKATIARDIMASMSEESVDFRIDDHADAEVFFKSVIAEVETRYGHVFEEAAQELYAWWNTFVEQWVIPTGRVDPKGWKKLREKYPRYVPMTRVMEDFTVSSDVPSGKEFIKRAKGSERDTYSPIESLEMMIIKNTKEYYAHHFEQTVANIFDTSMDEGGDLGEFVGAFIDEIDPYKTLGRNVNIKQQKQTLKDELVERYLDNIKHDSADGDAVAKEEAKKIADMSEEEVYDYVADRLGFSVMDMILQDNQTEFYKKLRDNLPKEIILVKTGKKYRAFRFKDREMEHALRKLNPGEIHTVAKIMGKFTRTFTALTTSKNFFFAFRNFIRDYQHAYVNDGDYIPGHFTVRTAVALGRSFKNEFYALVGKQQDDDYIAARAGLGFGSKYYAGEGTVETTFKDLKIGKMGQTKVGTAGKKLLRGVQFVGNTVEAVNASIEMSHRLAAFDKAMKQMEGKGIPRKEMYMIASEKAREVTVDFSNKGTGTKSLSQFVPFLGAGIAGIRQSQELIMDKDILRNTKAGHEKRMKLARALVAGVLPSVLEAMLAGWLVFDDDDDDYLEKAEREKTKREFQGVSKYIFNNYWVFKAGDTWVRIPKDREYTAMFGTSFQTLFMKALTDDFDDGEKNWDDFVSYAGYLMTQFIPPHEFTGWALVDAKFNKTWYGSDLISEMTMGEQFTPGYYQNITDEDTNKIANVVANAIADTPFVSEPLQESLGTLATPKGIDYVMRQLGGGAAEVILPWFTPSEGAAGLIANIVGQYTTNPNKSNIYTSDAYDTYDQLKAEVDFAGEDVDDRTAAWAEVFKNTMSTSSDYVTVGDLYKTIRETNANLDLSYKERMEIINGCYEDITAITSSLMAEYKKGGMPTKSSYGIVDRSAIPEWVKADGYNANEYIQYKEEFNRQLANLGGVKTNGAKNIALINANIPDNFKQAFQTHLINGGDYESVKKEYEHYINAGLNVDTIVDFESNVRGSDKEWKTDSRSVGLYIVGNSKYTAEEQRMLVMMNSTLSPKNQEKEYNAYVRGANAGWTPEKWYPVKMKINDLAGKYPSKADCRNAVAKLGYTGEDANIILGMYRTSWFG